MTTIGLVANVYNEAKALPGWLETHLPFFDDVRILHAGPNGEYSNDGTLELLSRWKIPVEFASITEGFGVVRSRAIHMSPCDYVMLLDADERFYHTHRVMLCSGDMTPHSEVDRILSGYDFRGNKTPDWNEIAKLGANLRVSCQEVYDQGSLLRRVIETESPDAVVAIRRHWHDFSFNRPTQNWHVEPDYQMRIIRRDKDIHFDPAIKMHERLIGANNLSYPSGSCGPFFDHFHFTFKQQEIEQRSHDVAIYDSIHKNETPPTWEQFRSQVK